MTAANCVARLLALGWATLAPAVQAAHPLQTEDTGTQGLGNIELETGLDAARAGAARSLNYQPQLSYGLTPTLDLIVQPSWRHSRDDGGSTVRGFGDLNLDLKWRFFGVDPVSFGIRAGLGLPTGQHDLGLPRGRMAAHATLVMTWDAAPFKVHGNLGVVRNPSVPGQRASLGLASAALTWAASERWTLAVDGGVQRSPEAGRSTWPGTLIVAAIYTWGSGLDLDIGRQTSLCSPVRAQDWLVGLTYRFAP